MQALLAVGFAVLCETVLHLVGEHFATASDSGRRHRVFTHFLGLITLGSVIAGIIYAVWLGSDRDLDNTDQAYVALLFVFLGLLLFHQAFRGPFLRFATTVFLIALVR